MVEVNFNPLPVFTSERLVLREMTKEDVDDVFKLRADESVSRYIHRNHYITIDEAEAFIVKIGKGISNNECGYWAIALKETNKLIGTTCLWHIDKENYRAEIGYELHPDYQRKGIMNEALPLILKYGFSVMKLHTLEAVVNPANTASIKLLEKNGFVREAYFKENEYYNNKFVDTAIYTLISPF
jgi:ribosomal-protein-alanine N-acetyltransferase